jgi:hypothetical protein
MNREEEESKWFNPSAVALDPQAQATRHEEGKPLEELAGETGAAPLSTHTHTMRRHQY